MRSNNKGGLFDLVLVFPCDKEENNKELPDIKDFISTFKKNKSLNLKDQKTKINLKSKNDVLYNKSIVSNKDLLEETLANYSTSEDKDLYDKDLLPKALLDEDIYCKYAVIFCNEIKKHRKYEMFFNDEATQVSIKRKPLMFGHVILYKDEIEDNMPSPIFYYNFFAVLSQLSVEKLYAEDDPYKYSFNIIYFVVPDIGYDDITLLMDQSHELWCNIMGEHTNVGYKNNKITFTEYLEKTFGYKYFGKIYKIILSDFNQFEEINKVDKDGHKHKFFNLLASETYKNEEKFTHQIELSENINEYEYKCEKESLEKPFTLTRKEKFFDDYNMYSSYKAYASLYTYYYVIKEEKREIFEKRMIPDPKNEEFSSEANILFVLENEMFKITACLAASKEINEQINTPAPNMVEIRKMFRRFINTRPLFEKLNYHYLGAQKEADFIYKQFHIGDIFADYDRKRELLKSYCEVNTSIISDNNAKKSNLNSNLLQLTAIIMATIIGRIGILSLSKEIKTILFSFLIVISLYNIYQLVKYM